MRTRAEFNESGSWRYESRTGSWRGEARDDMLAQTISNDVEMDSTALPGCDSYIECAQELLLQERTHRGWYREFMARNSCHYNNTNSSSYKSHQQQVIWRFSRLLSKPCFSTSKRSHIILFGTSQEKCRVMNANASDIKIIIFFKRRSNTMLTTRKLNRKHRERFYSQCPLLDGQFPLGDFLFPSLRVSNHSSHQVLRAFTSCRRCFYSSSPSRLGRK